MTLLPIHIVAGTIAIVSGAVAFYAVKGGRVHRKSGMIFVYAMLVMSSTAAVIASLQPNGANVLQGVFTFYLVSTAWLTVRKRGAGSRWIDFAGLLVAIAVGIAHITFGVQAMKSAAGKRYGYPPPLYFIFGPLALLAAW